MTIGTVTRAVRRYLGFQAAAEESQWRWLAKVSVSVRLWLLFGVSLWRLAPIAPGVAASWFRPGRTGRGSSAGEIIFRFAALEKVGRALSSILSFLALSNLWATMTAILVAAVVASVWCVLSFTGPMAAAALFAAILVAGSALLAIHVAVRQLERGAIDRGESAKAVRAVRILGRILVTTLVVEAVLSLPFGLAGRGRSIARPREPSCSSTAG